jgi:lysozyme
LKKTIRPMTEQTLPQPKSPRRFGGILLLVIMPLAVLYKIEIAAYFYLRTTCQEPRKRLWRNFDIPIPVARVYGIDVSHYSCPIQWNVVKASNTNGIRIHFAYMRATRGTRLVDYLFQENWQNAKAAGMPRGAYHFFHFNENAEDQADFFLRAVKMEKGDLPPVLDIEHDKINNDRKMDKEQILQGIANWLSKVEDATGVTPVIYTNLDYYKNYIAGRFRRYPVWIARYNEQTPPRLSDGRQWWFWQFSEKARIDGICEKVDMNVFSGDLNALSLIRKK